MRYSKQLQKMIKRPLMLAIILTFATGFSNAEADGMTQKESHSDSNLAAKNWENTNGPDTHDVAPSNNAGMATETWRSLDQPVTYSDSYLAAENWGNPNGPDTHAVEPSEDTDMAAENWRETR